MQSLKRKAKQSAQRAAFVSAGALLFLVGIGFLTLSAWFVLSAMFAPMEAALILAGGYLGLGLILMAVGLRNPDPAPEQPVAKEGAARDAPPLVQAFLYGMQAGAKAGSGSRG